MRRWSNPETTLHWDRTLFLEECSNALFSNPFTMAALVLAEFCFVMSIREIGHLFMKLFSFCKKAFRHLCMAPAELRSLKRNQTSIQARACQCVFRKAVWTSTPSGLSKTSTPFIGCPVMAFSVARQGDHPASMARMKQNPGELADAPPGNMGVSASISAS